MNMRMHARVHTCECAHARVMHIRAYANVCITIVAKCIYARVHLC